MKITIDFETRSAGVDLKKTNAWVYAADPACEVMCLAVAVEDKQPRIWATPHFRSRAEEYSLANPGDAIHFIEDQELRSIIENATVIEAHNYGFEQAVWTRIMVPRHGFPEIRSDKWACTMARCARFALPQSLGEACSVLQLPVQKDAEGRKLMLRMTRPRRLAAEGVHWHETPSEVYRLMQYCMQDVVAERVLSEALPELCPFERAVFVLDGDINRRGVHVDIETIRDMQVIEDIAAEALANEFAEIAGCSHSQVSRVIAVLEANGLAVPSLDKDAVRTALMDENISPKVRRILELRQILSRTSTAKLDAMLACACSDSRVRGVYQYHGAHTGRWAGRTVQTQNLPRGSFTDTDTFIALAKQKDIPTIELLFGEVIDGIVTCIRPMITAAPGKVLVCADFASIEGRMLAWLAGESHVLDAYVKGRDMYKIAAMSIYHCGYDDVTKAQRQIGKVAELALGYGGGEGAFLTMAGNYGVRLGEGEATIVKETWREARPQTVSLWRGLNKAAMSAVREPGTYQQYRSVYYRVVNDGQWPWPVLECSMPSGRKLHYHNPTIQPREKPWGVQDSLIYWGVDSITHRWQELETYGGKLTENIVQALCRDVQATAMVRISKEQNIVMHTHDEITTEIPQSVGGEAGVSRLLAAMKTPVGWAPGLPIEAEAWFGERYRK